MEKDAEKVFHELKNDVSDYVELKLELLKLSTYERIGKVTAILSYGLVLLFLAFFAVLFVFIALGFFLGERLGSVSSGFAIVAALYLVLLTVILMNKEKIRIKVLNIIIAALMANDDKDDATGQQQPTDSTPETDF